MNSFFSEVRQTLAPDVQSPHGPLTPLLIAMTFVTGLVDAFSYLVLGHVFVANMTGNVVFLGFALAGAPDFSILDSFVALVSFGFGALAGGRLGSQLGHDRGKHLSTAATIQGSFSQLRSSWPSSALARSQRDTTMSSSSSSECPWASRTPQRESSACRT